MASTHSEEVMRVAVGIAPTADLTRRHTDPEQTDQIVL